MSDEQYDEFSDSIRRVSKKDRKRRLDPVDSLFPEEMFAPPEDDAEAQADVPEADVESAADIVEAFPVESPPRDVPPEHRRFMPPPLHVPPDVPQVKSAPRPVEILEPEERFPPLAPEPEPDIQPAVRVGEDVQPKSYRKHNLVAAFFFLAAFGMCVYYTYLWFDPYSALNPLAPATPFIVITTTPSGSGADFVTPTLRPSQNTGVSFPFVLAETGVVYIPNANGRECNWASIAGSVIGLNGEALTGYGILITGEDLRERVFSGSSLTFGEGGWELSLGGAPVAAELTMQLTTPTGVPISDTYTVTTRDSCDSNVAIVTFIQVQGF